MTVIPPPVPAPRPATKVPELSVPLVGGGQWNIREQLPSTFTMVVCYRGLHCPACRGQLREVDECFPDLASRGVEAVAISANDRASAERTREEWDLRNVPLGYDLDVETMRQWGLYVSEGTNESEPAHFNEPGLFLVSPDQTLYYSAITNMPFGRPKLEELISGIDFVVRQNHPPHGGV